jgi:hypothetical protein
VELSPQDAVAALRSFPRRFAAALDVTDGDERGLDAAVAETDRAGRTLAVLADAVARTLTEDRPTLHPAVGDASARVFPDVDVPAEAALDLLTLEAQSLGDRAEHVAAADWGRAAVVPGAEETTAVGLLREAVRVVAAHLHTAERARGRT